MIAGTIIGVAVLVLPRILTAPAGHAAPLAMGVGALISLFTVFCWVKVGTLFPGLTVVEYAEHVIGRFPAFVFRLAFAAYILTIAALVAREFGEVVITAVLTQTPLEVTTIVMLILAAMLARYDLQVIGRTFEILFPLIVLPAAFVALLSLRNARAIYLLPVWEGSIESFALGVVFATVSLQGTMLIPMFMPSVNLPARSMNAGIWAAGISGVVHILVVVAALAVFNVNEIERLLWPTLELMRTTVVPGNVLERIEAIFLAVWVAAVFTTIAGALYAAIVILQKTLRLQDHKTLIPLIIPLLYIVAMQPDNILALYGYLEDLRPLVFALSVVTPITFFVLARIRGIRKAQQ